MKFRFVLGALAIGIAASGCAASDVATGPDGPWVGSSTTEDDVTAVINESGSVWGGVATVVEEASIGAGSGEVSGEFAFGEIAWVYESGGTLYVVDPQAPAVHTYDHAGNALGTLGAAGDGPGEYTDPHRVAVAPDGRIFVSEPERSRIHVYAADGAPVETWNVPMSSLPSSALTVDAQGVLWAPIAPAEAAGPGARPGMQALPAGQPGERAVIEQFGGQVLAGAGERLLWTPAGGGELIVGRSVADAYRFEVQRRGATELVVERSWQPTTVNPDFDAWFQQVYGRERPPTLPPYLGFTKAASGEIWVTRPANARRVADCHEDLSNAEAARADPCWVPDFLVDVFGDDGRYLGAVDLPDDIVPFPQWMHIDGDMLIARSVEGDRLRVKRFRLRLPPQPGQ